MSALLAPLAPIANLLLPSSENSTGSSNNPSTSKTIFTPSNTTIPVPTASNYETLDASVQETGAPELSSSIAASVPLVPNPAALGTSARATGSRKISMQTISTQTDSDIEFQRAAPATGPIITAGTTGLYGTLPGRGSPSRLPVLERKKHSAAARYLRTANARDLPSYPSAGLSHPEAAGAAAALLAHKFHKPVEIWKPDPFSAAGAAASLAHTSPKRVAIWRADPEKPEGKAALNVLRDFPPQPYQISEASKRWSLNGAIGAMQGSKVRRCSDSSPASLTTRQETEATRAGNSALTAATIAHMPMVRNILIATEYPSSESLAERKLVDAGRVPQQDKRKSDIPRAATISMFESNRDTISPPDTHKHKALVQPDLQLPATTPPSRRYNNSNIEEAARKVAAERLAKIGYNTDIPRPASLLGTQGARASLNRSYSAAGPNRSNFGRARKIDADMALAQENSVRVDAKKRGENAILLMSTAQQNVQARMSRIDKQVAESRGLVRREDWDAKAIEVAQAGSDKRMEYHGKVSIGGGAYMTPGEIDAIAEKNVQPVLDEINRNAEAERARLQAERVRELEVRLDDEESKRVQDLQRTREREIREDIKRAKAWAERNMEAVEKEEEKRRKDEQKRVMKERKQLAKIDSKRGRESMGTGSTVDLRSPTSSTSPKSDSSEGVIRGLINRFRRRHSRQISHDERNAIGVDTSPKGSPVVPTFSGGHRAAMAEQEQQQRAAGIAGDEIAANGGTSPRSPISRIPRPVSAVIMPRTNGTTVSPGPSPGLVRTVVIAGAPSPIAKGNTIEVRRRHSLPSVGSTGYRFKGRKLGDGAALSPWNEDEGVKKGKSKANGKTTRDFSKSNGRIVTMEDHLDYPDEARDTFSQQPTVLNRPTSGYFPQDERRFSAGETSVSSRFRENL